MLTAKEAAKYVGRNVSTISRWKRSGYLHARSVGGRDYFYMDEIKELTTPEAS
jgi:excisionase family DNA binding protein